MAVRTMPRSGWRDYEKQKVEPPWRGIVILVLTLTCGGLGASLYSARLAHGTLWQRFQGEREFICCSAFDHLRLLDRQ